MRLLLQFPTVLSNLSVVNPLLNSNTDKKRAFSDSKLKFVKALMFRSFHETEALTAFYCFTIVCGRAYFVPIFNCMIESMK